MADNDGGFLKKAFGFFGNFFQKPSEDPAKSDEQSLDWQKIFSGIVGLFFGNKLGNTMVSKLALTAGLAAVGYFATNWIKDNFNAESFKGLASNSAPSARNTIPRVVWDPETRTTQVNVDFVDPSSGPS